MRLAGMFTDHMVLQRDRAILVWGWAVAGERVAVELAGSTAEATTDADGRWSVQLPAMPAGGPHTLTARGSDTLILHDVLVGEVWLCSGQSNMEWPLSLSSDGATESAEANYPEIRMLTVPRQFSLTPVADVVARWGRCTPHEAAQFSGVGYYFGREIYRALGVPVGLISSSWGGTVAQAWTSGEGLVGDPALGRYVEELRQNAELMRGGQAHARYEEERAKFLMQLPQDAGNRGLAEGWAHADCDDTTWGTMELPEYWLRAGHPTNGVFWFRLTVDIPSEWVGHELQLSLGAVDKSDDTYFNGERVGGLTWVEKEESWCTPRTYGVPASGVRAGRNVIAVRVLSNYTGGGLVGPAGAMDLRPKGLAGAKAISLAGAWRYRIEQDFGMVREPAHTSLPQHQNLPSVLFNGMIAPIVPYGLRGAIWYQGESNAADAAGYRVLFPAMIRDWRRHWGMEDLAFHFVQLANYVSKGSTAEYEDTDWARIRESQAAARELPHTGMAVAIDIGDPQDIHPRNKRDVGLRLALSALATTYGQAVEYRGPTYRSLRVDGSALRIAFDHADGLTVRTGPLRSFAVAGADRVFHVATGRVEGGDVVVSSPAVAKPVAARYGWGDSPPCTLYNGAHLPAEPFRTDDW